MTRRELFAMAAAAPLSRGLLLAAEARKQIKITGLETDLLRIPAAPYSDAIHDFGGEGGVGSLLIVHRPPASARGVWRHQIGRGSARHGAGSARAGRSLACPAVRTR